MYYIAVSLFKYSCLIRGRQNAPLPAGQCLRRRPYSPLAYSLTCLNTAPSKFDSYKTAVVVIFLA